ncbi:Opioid growth factor receptor (OGFr) conserved region family protein [Leishmania donovani]|uniref:Opioid growth factor receptor (OGFr) conserved region family protein n=1 Tax=Leishmania donovani TaxID=5661 RepID=A0A504XA07_LEIDO|nr:Opioid growth factor receptor (OGFr) conserved region family protein [Leishmania donovani]
MEYSAPANAHTRQETQRCLRLDHEAHERCFHISSVFPLALPPHITPPWNEHASDRHALSEEAYRGRCDGNLSHHDLLEYCHNYAQWRIPLRRRGGNWQALPLTMKKAAQMQANGLAVVRLLQAFRMILRFSSTCITRTPLPNGVRLSSEADYTRVTALVSKAWVKQLHVDWLEFLAHEAMT